ncbi:hypothetical protein NQ176_g2231 [Zarea fungicola]|uniref:Uncharacterized protein n=1 Tax=Zarea fungicola TaxID=93591 RepID=A0ACC1NPA3_9HYPO|nr:hypothetical protein NQ176_g2231 [Lecanicillium fungicola]
MTSAGKARHALFEGFEKAINSNSYLDDPEILGRACPAIVESGERKGLPCRNACVKTTVDVTELWKKLSDMTAIKNEKTLIRDLRKLIKASHCHDHGKPKRIRVGLQNWKEDQLARYLLSSNVTSEAPAGRTCSQGSFTDCSHDTEVDCTPSEAALRAGVVNGDGESFDNITTTLEVQARMEKVPCTDIANHEVSVSSESERNPEIGATVTSAQKNEASATETTQMMSKLTLDAVAPLPRSTSEPKRSMKRAVSLRDNSGVVRAFHKRFTELDKKEGVLYVLAKENAPGIFKIGWSQSSAEHRLRQCKNCYAIGATIIYESPTAFLGAYRAETCIHAIFKNEKLQNQCVHCGVMHREYFQAPRVDVLRTVALVEYILRLPGYECNAEREWKLSDAANGIVHTSFKIDVTAMEMALTQVMAATTASTNEKLDSVSIPTSNDTTTSQQDSKSGERVFQEKRTRLSLGHRMGSGARAIADMSNRIWRSITTERNMTAERSFVAELKARSAAVYEMFVEDFKKGYAQTTPTRT